MNGPCAKQVVTATVVAANGRRFTGTNDCRTPQAACPRKGMPSGVGYDLCHSVCGQTAHAEVNALREAGLHAKGAVLHLAGHTYCCAACTRAANAYGISRIVIEPQPES